MGKWVDPRECTCAHVHVPMLIAHAHAHVLGGQHRAPGNMGICLMMERGPICHKLMSTAVAVDTSWRECTQLGSSSAVHAVRIWDGVFRILDPVFHVLGGVFNHFPG